MTILKDFIFECRNDTGPFDRSDCSTRLWLTTPHLFCFHTQTAIHHGEQVWDQCRIELPSIVLTNDGDTNEFWEFLASRCKQKTLKCHCVWLAVAAQPEEVISSHVTLNTFIEPVNCSKHWKQRMGFISQVLNLFTGESWMFCVCLLWVVLCTRRDCALWRGVISAVGVRSSIPLIPPSQTRFFLQPVN